MKQRPILFSTAMVQAILEGRKTQTRRVVKPQPPIRITDESPLLIWCDFDSKNNAWTNITANWDEHCVVCPYGKPGDVLWVRETWAPALGDYAYKADYSQSTLDDPENKGLWKPSIHMPKEACRLFLRVKSVRVERLNSITADDTRSEGYPNAAYAQDGWVLAWFKELWQKINGAESWDANPWVWVVEFERIEKPTTV